MNTMRCIIVDDEPIARKILQEFTEQVPFLEAVGQFDNPLKAEAFLQQNQADLMLLDIEMPKLNGLEYLKKTPVQPLVIITTAFPNYALEGYELDIIDYLLKPVAFHRFLKAVQKAKEYATLKQAATSSPVNASYLFVRSEKRIEKIELKDILHIESMGNYVIICTEQKKIIAYLTMKSMESQLPVQDFIKIHQSYLVSIAKIEAIEGNTVNVRGKILPISRQHRDAVMQLVAQRLLRR